MKMFVQSQPWSMLVSMHKATIVGEQENTGGINNHQCTHEQKKTLRRPASALSLAIVEKSSPCRGGRVKTTLHCSVEAQLHFGRIGA